MTDEEKKPLLEIVSKGTHDLRGSVTVMQLLIGSWEMKKTDVPRDDYEIFVKEIEKMKATINVLSQSFKEEIGKM